MSDHRDQLLSIFLKHRDSLTRFLVRRIGNPDTAQDLVQETWLRLATGGVPDQVANPQAYLFRIATNLANDRQRYDRTRTRYLVPDTNGEDVADTQPDAERNVAGHERLAQLRRIVDELPARCRTVFILRRFDDLSHEEIAQRLGISRNMVEKHLRKALLHCASRLAAED